MIAAFVPEAVQQLILGGMTFVIGVMCYLALKLNLPAAIRCATWTPFLVHHDGKRVVACSWVHLGYAAARLGTALLLLLVLELVFRAPEIPLDVRSVLFLIGLALTGGGYLIVAVNQEDAK